MTAQVEAAIRAKVIEVMAIVRQKYPTYTKPDPTVTFYPKGLVAGRAYYHQNRVAFNLMLAGNNLQHFLDDTVSHEIAHLVCKAVHGKRGHGPLWKQVDRALGGDGSRCWKGDAYTIPREQLKARPGNSQGFRDYNAAKSMKYLYTDRKGVPIWLGVTRHKRLRDGRVNYYEFKDRSGYVIRVVRTDYQHRASSRPDFGKVA